MQNLFSGDNSPQYGMAGSRKFCSIQNHPTLALKFIKERMKKTMARVPQITRTMRTTKAKILCLDLIDKQPIVKDVVLPRTFKDEKALMKAVKALYETDVFKCVNCESQEVVETLYGMSEQKFIDNADILPPRK